MYFCSGIFGWGTNYGRIEFFGDRKVNRCIGILKEHAVVEDIINLTIGELRS